MAGFTLAARNKQRDATNGRISVIKLFDDAGTARYTQTIQTKSTVDGQINILQSLLASEGNGYALTRLQIINTDSSVEVDTAISPALDKRTTSPYYNVAVNFTISLRF